MARLGNGIGHGPGRGDGWGGPARGIGSTASTAPAFPRGNKQAAGLHDTARAQRKQRLMDMLFHLAFNGTSDEAKLAATIAWLDRYEGKPIGRVINFGGNAAGIDDATLAALVAKYEALTSDERG